MIYYNVIDFSADSDIAQTMCFGVFSYTTKWLSCGVALF